MCLIYISLRFSFGPPALQNWSFFVLGLRLKQSLRHEARFKKGFVPPTGVSLVTSAGATAARHAAWRVPEVTFQADLKLSLESVYFSSHLTGIGDGFL